MYVNTMEIKTVQKLWRKKITLKFRCRDTISKIIKPENLVHMYFGTNASAKILAQINLKNRRFIAKLIHQCRVCGLIHV